MKRKAKLSGMIVLVLCLLAHQETKAQIPIVSLITSAIKKAIMAIDLKVQQLQNKTIALQNAEAQLTNKMSLNNLNDISGWLNKEKALYSNYYNELQQVKKVIAEYDEVKQASQQQLQLVSEYKTAYNLFRQDKNFSPGEIHYMGTVYNGLLQESIRNLDEVLLAVSPMQTQMTDGERLSLVHKASANMQRTLNDMRQFNNKNRTVTLQRAQDNNDMQTMRQLYGLPN
jgi:hypothetical protein